MNEMPPSIEGTKESEDQLYNAFCETQEAEDTLMREMDGYMKSHSDLADAEKEALEIMIPGIEAAKARTKVAFEKWIESVRKL